jgi:hypothetical protein
MTQPEKTALEVRKYAAYLPLEPTTWIRLIDDFILYSGSAASR